MIGRGIRTQRRMTRRSAKGVGREEGFLLTTLLQSALCIVMLVFAFAAGQHLGMTEVKSCFETALSNESEALAVFSVTKNEQGIDSIGRLRTWLIDVLNEALGLDFVPSGQGGQLLVTGSTLPSGVTLAMPVLSASMTQPIRGRMTSEFGFRTHPITENEDFHTGIDLAAPRGTPIGAVYPGEVVEVGESEIYGKYITMFHRGFATRYCHCEEIIAREGMQLRQGETVALVGSTGMSTGPHLHLELIVKGKNVDPLSGAEGWEW